MSRITARRRVTKVTLGQEPRTRPDHLVAEEPLEIRVLGRQLAVTMRTPGQDIELAAGFLVSEAVIHAADQFRGARYCADQPRGHDEDGTAVEIEAGNTYNILDVTLSPETPPPAASLERNVFTSSSCGLCGKASIDAVHTASHFRVDDDPLEIAPELLVRFPDELRAAQAVFERTGGLHAAALFDGRTGEMLVLREDVGRHNAVDKVIGWAFLEGRLPLRGMVLMVSGRASFELVQKALMAGIPMLTAVSAPSSLAVDLAADSGLTLVGFLRGDSMNVYAHGTRLLPPAMTPSTGAPQHDEREAHA